MNPLHATIEAFAADGYTHVECFCPRCRMARLRPIGWLPRISMGLTIAQLSERSGALSAAVHCTRSSRGEWKTFQASRWGAEDDLVAGCVLSF